MLKKIENFILSNKLFTRDEKIILAVSGGIDSMVLFDCLIKLGFNFLCCHVNHNKRQEAINDFYLVRDVCERHDIALEYLTLSYPENEKFNFQEYARKKRYEFFLKIALENNIKKILTAHHANDNLESILLKLARGSNIYGYAGINPVLKANNLLFVRPLIEITKEEIVSYQRENNIFYLEDKTNDESFYLRNYYRHEVIPVMLERTPKLLEKSGDYSKILFDAFTFIRKNTLIFLAENSEFSITNFKVLDKAIQMDVISYLFEQNGISASFSKIEEIIRQISTEKAQFSYELAPNKFLYKEYDRVSFGRNSSEMNTYIINNIIELKAFNNEFFYFTEENENNCLKKLKLCYNNIDFPIEIRPKKAGDYLEFNYGRKKLKNLFIDLKLPLQERKKILVVSINGNKVIWIPELDIKPEKDALGLGYLVYKK